MARKLAIALLMLGLGLVSWEAAYDILDNVDTATSTEEHAQTMTDGTPMPQSGGLQ
jgi:hypothetical protein